MRKEIILIILSLFILLTTIVYSDSYDNTFSYVVGNETYSFTTDMELYKLDWGTSYIGFNATYFNVTSTAPIWINLTYLDEDIVHLITGEKALEFNSTTNTGGASFVISGFKTNQNYTITRNGTLMSTVTSSLLGVVTFTNDATNECKLEINATTGSAKYPPILTLISPGNNSFNVALEPTLYVYCSDPNGDHMNVTWSSNSTGSWKMFATNSNIISGITISKTNSNFSNYYTKYYWSVNASDGEGNSTEAIYYFTTLNETVVEEEENPEIELTALDYMSGGFLGADKFYLPILTNLTENTTIIIPSSYADNWLFFSTQKTVSSVLVYGIDLNWNYVKVPTIGKLLEFKLDVSDFSDYEAFVIVPNPGYFQTSEWWFGMLNKAQSVFLTGEAL